MIVKRLPPVGSRPGTLVLPADSPPPRIYLFDYDEHQIEERDIRDQAELEPYRERASTTWIDIQGMGEEAPLRRVAEIFGIHPLALEDAVNVPQRAKTELYDQHQLIIARAVDAEEDAISAPQVCFLVGSSYLITFQERYFGFFDPVRERIRAGIGPIRTGGPDYLAYALIDTIVDRYYPVVDDVSSQLDELEDEILQNPRPESLVRLHRLRRKIAILRRVGWPQRETIGELQRETTPYIREPARVFLRDSFDHSSQIMGRVDFCREVAVGLMDIYLSNVSFRSNEVMKVLTIMASIFIPLTFIAGIYGMNFENMPELSRPWAYPMALSLMGAVAVGMVFYFWRRGWIGGGARRRKPRD